MAPNETTVTKDADFGALTVVVREYDRPRGTNDELITAQTIGMMQWLSDRDAASPAVLDMARTIAAEAPDPAAFKAIADSIFAAVKARVHYLHEDELHTPFKRPDKFRYDQTLIPPAALLAMPEPKGDCPHYSMLTASLCRVCGIPSAYKTIAADPADPKRYSHVYVVAQIAPGEFYPLDTSNAPAPGEEYARPLKARVWPNHQDTSKEGMIRTRRTYALIHRSTGRLADLYDDIGAGDASQISSPGGVPWSDPGITYPVPGATEPGTDWTKLITVFANDASKIAAPLIATNLRQQPYYIQGAGGAQVLYDPNTGQVATAKTTGTTDLSAIGRGLTSAIPATYLAIAAAVLIGGVVLFASRRS